MTSEKIEKKFEAPLLEKERILKSLNKLRYEYIEEFPTEKLLPDHPNYHLYKCRTNFFNNVSLNILRLQRIGLISSPEATQVCEDFLKFCETIVGTSKFYQQEDIDKANKVLDCLIKELS